MVSALIGADNPPAFSYPDTAAARQHWQPQFGSKLVRVEQLADGSTCIALDAEFQKPGDRACWDWTVPLDLSTAGHFAFEVSATNGGLGGNIGIYFGTANGWYSRFWWGGVPDAWSPKNFRLSTFSQEDKPDGWDKVTTFRVSIWSTGAGKTTYRLRNFQVQPIDLSECFLKNGSFEVPGVGVPYGWGSGHWGVGHLPWATNMDLWRKHWHLDQTVAKHGSASLRIESTADLPRLAASSVWVTLPKAASAYTLSAWLKSDRDKLPVTLSCDGRSMTAEAGLEWTQAKLNIKPESTRVTVAIAPQATGTLWIDSVQLQAGSEPTPDFHAAPADDLIAQREQRVDWTPPTRSAKIAAGRSISGAIKATKVEIDQHGRFLVDGKPYIQHSFGLEFVSDLNLLNFVADSGFRDVCIQVRETITTARLRAMFERCALVGLRIIPWLDGRIKIERFSEHINALKDHPALLCWYVYDEPSGERFAKANERLRIARKLDPGHPAFINYLGNKLEEHLGDIYSTDIYPIPHGSPTGAINGVVRMSAAAKKEHKPVWMWLQGTGYAYWMDREPTPRELSCMAYGSLISGARGIYYFAQVPRTKECFDEMRALCVEIEAITPALSSLEAAPEISLNKPNILRAAYAHNRLITILAVNTQNTAQSVQLGLISSGSRVEVLFEDRQCTAKNGVWEDTFGPYERHVYQLRQPEK